jgi:hypothetical protein
MQITAVASQHVSRMFMQMLLKEESRTFPIFKIKTVRVSDFDIKWYVPQTGATEWTAVSAGRRNFVELDSGFSKFCRDGYLSLCDFRIPVCGRNYMTCSGALYYGQIDVASELL